MSTVNPYVDKGRLRAFIKKKPLCEKSWGVAQSEHKPANNNEGK